MMQQSSVQAIYHCRYFDQWPWLVHGVTTRRFCQFSASMDDTLLELINYFGLNNVTVVVPQQKHTNKVRVVSDLTLRRINRQQMFVDIPGVDALVTPLTDTLLTIRTADCVPVQMVDPLERIIGLVHAGWKGTLGRIVQKAIREFIRLGARESNLYLFLGPSVCAEHYTVGEQRIALFRRHFPDCHERFITGRRLDLIQCNRLQAMEMGIPPANIRQSDLCTVHHNELFYSFRANDCRPTGDNISFLMIRSGESR
ncbi:MAG: hypothetical protein Kow0059_00530 [Candidatus Sumerlaeia bacterium]